MTGQIDIGSFRKRWELWNTCLSSDDPNSVFQQIYSLVFDAAMLRVIQRSVELNPKQNDLLHRFISNWFFISHSIKIRGLVDSGKLEGDKSVYSIRSLVKDLIDNVSYLTIEYYEEIPDSLSEIPSLIRDGTVVKYLKAIERRINIEFKSITNYANKLVAHPSSIESREHEPVAPDSLGNLRQYHKTLFQIANILDADIISGTEHVGLPFTIPGKFELLDVPLFQSSQIKKAYIIWEEFASEVEDWRSSYYSDVMKMLNIEVNEAT